MLTRLHDVDRAFWMMDELRRRMTRMFDDFDGRSQTGGFIDELEPGWESRSTAPRVNVYDAGSDLLVTAEVPGLVEKDLHITLNQDVLTLRGERTLETPKNYSAHRRERRPFTFSRSFTLPCKVDSEKASATLKDGVLTLTIAKAREAQPRQITVRAQ